MDGEFLVRKLSIFWTARAQRKPARGTPASERRCAQARGREPEAQRRAGDHLRCCCGAPNAERMRDPEDHVPFREIDLALEDLRPLLLRDARTKELAEGTCLLP